MMNRKTTGRFGLGLIVFFAGAAVIFPRITAPNPSAGSRPCTHGNDRDQENCSHYSHSSAGFWSGGRQRAETGEEARSAGHAGFGESAAFHSGGGE